MGKSLWFSIVFGLWFQEGGRKQVKLATGKHTHSWDNTNFFCSILDQCHHLDSSKGSMKSTLNDVLDKVLTGKKINLSKSVPFLCTSLTINKQTSKYTTLHPHPIQIMELKCQYIYTYFLNYIKKLNLCGWVLI